MTPKEQANELILKFSALTEAERCRNGHEMCKQCAIIYCEGMCQERIRAVNIAYEFHKKAEQRALTMRDAGGPIAEIAFAKWDVAEECRYIGNAISGKNALTMNNKDYWDLVKDEILKM